MEILNKIQQNLRAPKGQTNKFGGYKYRSCEDIFEAVKPLLGVATLIIEDEMIMLGDRYYIKATATLKDGDETATATAYARESFEKKGMDASQITGATSSYARKYALNGLFLIDDQKDADNDDNRESTVPDEDSASEVKNEPSEAYEKATQAVEDTKTLQELDDTMKLVNSSKKLTKAQKQELSTLAVSKSDEMMKLEQPFP